MLGLALAALYLFANAPSGTFGFTGDLLTGGPTIRITAVAAGGAAQREGLHNGDTLTITSSALRDRAPFFLFENAPLVVHGDIVRVKVNGNHFVRLVAMPNPENPRYEAVYFCILAIPMLLLGWFIVWKRPKHLDASMLGAMLLMFGIWIAVPDRVGAPLPRFLLFEILGSAGVITAVALAAIFFARYPDGRGIRTSRARRVLLRIAIVASTIELALMTFSYAAPGYVGNVPWIVIPTTVLVLTPVLTAFWCFIEAYRAGDATERMRLRWLGGSYFLGFTGPVLLPPATLLLGPNFTVIHQVLLESSLFILAFGLTYAILWRRIVDISFVLNRALVFSAVSAIVVALFISVEWLAGLMFLNASRPTSFLVEAGIAVAIGFSLRPIHQRVDKSVDRLFFAKRHASEQTLHHLATEVMFIRDREALLGRVQRDITLSLETSLVSVYFRDEVQRDFLLLCSTADAPELIGADDDAAVALAVREQAVELHRRDTAMRGEIAIPIAIRKALLGVLIVGDRTSQEAYTAPEIESLQFIANNLGPALSTKSGFSNGAGRDPILGEILAELKLLNARTGGERTDTVP